MFDTYRGVVSYVRVVSGQLKRGTSLKMFSTGKGYEVKEAGVLALPGTMFQPETHSEGARQFRIAFANVNRSEVGVLFDRLAALRWPIAET